MQQTTATLLLAALVTSCSASAEHSPDTGSAHDAGQHGDAHAMGDTSVDVYADGLMKVSTDGHFHVMLMNAEPAPPDVGQNTWTLRIVDMDDVAVDDATVTVSPFMPLHGHGTSPPENAATFSSDGTYEAGPFDLFMPGLWESTVTIEAGETRDSAIFSFELEG